MKQQTHIFGPSHCVRLKRLIELGVLHFDTPLENIQGSGGVPIWSKTQLVNIQNLIDMRGGGEMVFILIGDFRFGNEICKNDKSNDIIFIDGYVAINKEFIDNRYDIEMQKRCVSAIDFYLKTFGNSHQIKLIFWDMFCRQIQDRLSGKYIVNNKYCHPHFSIEKIREKIPTIDKYLLNLDLLLHHFPMHELNRLFIDSSCHPSQIGYIFLNNIINHNLDILTSYNLAVKQVEDEFIDLAKKLFIKFAKKTIIIGESKWLYSFINYLGANGVQKLSQVGIIVSTISKIKGRPHFLELIKDIKIGHCNIVLISKLTNNIKNELSLLFKVDTKFWDNLSHIDWDSSVEKYILLKEQSLENNDNIKLTHNEIKIEESFVELNADTKDPTMDGIKFILNHISGNTINIDIKDLYEANVFMTSNNSLLTNKNIAFLMGGNHSVLNYSIGKSKISDQSLINFQNNIINRYNFCKSLNISYNHVLFPDKQSVLVNEFPFNIEVCLGDYYLKNLSSDLLSDKVIYPLDLLRDEHNKTKNVFLDLDTHMAENGSILVINLILKKLGLDNTAVNDLYKLPTITKLHKGDIGRFFDNAVPQKVNCLDINYDYLYFKSKSLFNDGLYFILINKNGVYKKTLLLFGDSFFGNMLHILSYFFKMVICLRTRYFHKEMVISIEPDIVLTGNVERYLSFVDTDNNAPLFMCYDNFVKEAEDIKTKNTFPDIWKSITSPNSEFAKNVFNNIYNIM